MVCLLNKPARVYRPRQPLEFARREEIEEPEPAWEP